MKLKECMGISGWTTLNNKTVLYKINKAEE